LVASVAQLAEQLTLNQLVEGSSPSRGTTFAGVLPVPLCPGCQTRNLRCGKAFPPVLNHD
jgi:hypothetical protein